MGDEFDVERIGSAESAAPTKNEVLKRQIRKHETTKAQFRQKITEYQKLKQRNENTLWLRKGDNEQHRDEETRYEKRHKNCIEEIEQIHIEMQQIRDDAADSDNAAK